MEVTQNGISTTFIKQAKNLEELLKIINKKKMGQMEYQVFTGKPYTFDNLVYSHHT